MSLPKITISQPVRELFPVASRIAETFETDEEKKKKKMESKEHFEMDAPTIAGISIASIFGFIGILIALVFLWGLTWNTNKESLGTLSNNIGKKLFDSVMATIFSWFFLSAPSAPPRETWLGIGEKL